MRQIPTALTIAGSDSGGGAGIQADLRTFSFHRVHGMSAITCVTAQNTTGVARVDALTPEAVAAQIGEVVKDIGVDAAKTGMLLNAPIIEAVAQQVEHWEMSGLVVDPVMVSRTGAQLIDDPAIATLKGALIPQALVLTPNRYEAQMLSGVEIDSLDSMKEAAAKIYDLGPQYVMVKGGGMTGPLQGVDVVFAGDTYTVLETETVQTPHTHGTGCTLSAAIAANLALGKDPLTALGDGKDYVTAALHHALAIGQGTGPVGHFFPLFP
ncbi:bifunctional hydroxymethylpyrimidine kinase/phosphomethylpyrimidine kinase [Spirulina sp. CS-785/01]|uniref:bifunctional hydroxymethylpyrimidine kinase/phosphomethylpyrimidine kinase n=1 Tax=Spirulina sp. CS-785/01 TaxID=3021716 RepID=UPI00232C94FA|nr:bifunctional hydroxymethylpyrimidine kinase/phosphomethylpyrimidine kinase [Spirulina sp. CS-785/01]MDB9313673.1 bifunctional hydroxymethylpyrimidine kinase/phosphomethylpyrimidine kinase [Spirulina sp. CS-785/01]